jgi:hypothetical protein
MSTLQNFVTSKDEIGLAKFAFLMSALTDEVIEELTDTDEVIVGAYMERMGEVIAWIGHGDISRLPDEMRVFAEKLQEIEA